MLERLNFLFLLLRFFNYPLLLFPSLVYELELFWVILNVFLQKLILHFELINSIITMFDLFFQAILINFLFKNRWILILDHFFQLWNCFLL
jgi:hypothetical protein